MNSRHIELAVVDDGASCMREPDPLFRDNEHENSNLNSHSWYGTAYGNLAKTVFAVQNARHSVSADSIRKLQNRAIGRAWWSCPTEPETLAPKHSGIDLDFQQAGAQDFE